jgi:glutaredoxin 3
MVTATATTTKTSSTISSNNRLQTPQSATLFIQEQSASHQVVIWSKSYCPYCKATKELFRSKFRHADVVIHELDFRTDGSVLQQELFNLTGQHTVPNVFVNGQHVGGNDSVQAAYQNGTLALMVNMAQ